MVRKGLVFVAVGLAACGETEPVSRLVSEYTQANRECGKVIAESDHLTVINAVLDKYHDQITRAVNAGQWAIDIPGEATITLGNRWWFSFSGHAINYRVGGEAGTLTAVLDGRFFYRSREGFDNRFGKDTHFEALYQCDATGPTGQSRFLATQATQLASEEVHYYSIYAKLAEGTEYRAWLNQSRGLLRVCKNGDCEVGEATREEVGPPIGTYEVINTSVHTRPPGVPAEPDFLWSPQIDELTNLYGRLHPD